MSCFIGRIEYLQSIINANLSNSKPRQIFESLSGLIICILRRNYIFLDRRGRRSLQGEIKLPYEDRRGRRSLQGEIKLSYEDRRGRRSLQGEW